MTVSSGFFNAVGDDRLYDATQMSSIFDGIISDGVFMQYGTKMVVRPATGMNIIVGEGRAWFNHTWTYNDADLVLAVDPADVVLPRVDAVVLEVNSSDGVRANSIKVIKGTPATNAVAPTMIKTSTVNQYPLAYISIPVGLTAITQSQLTNKVGTSDTPYVTGIIETVNVDTLVAQWQSQFDDWAAGEQADFDAWFANVQGQLSTDPAGNLQNQLDALTASNNTAHEEVWTAIGMHYEHITVSEAILAERVQRNLLTNGNFQISKRNFFGGNPNLGAGYHWVVDRWRTYRTDHTEMNDWWGWEGTYVADCYVELFRPSGNSNVSPLNLVQEFETADTIELVGKKVTFSIKARNYMAPTTIELEVITGTGLDQNTYSGFTDQTVIASQQFTYAAASTVYSVTTPVIADTVTQIAFRVRIVPVGTAGSNEHYKIERAKVEYGEHFTGWSFPSKQETLAKCQRYCYVLLGTGSSMPFSPYVYNVTNVMMPIRFPVTLRAIPTVERSWITGLTPGIPTGATDHAIAFLDGGVPTWLNTTGTFGIDLTSGRSLDGMIMGFTSTGANFNLAPQRLLTFFMGQMAKIHFDAEL